MSSRLRSTTASRSLIVATSSTCSLMNHCMNCSDAKSLSSRAVLSRPLIWSVTLLLLVERQAHRRDDVLEGGDRRLDAGDHDIGVGVEEVLHHHHRVGALLQRLGVEERGHPRHGQRVVVDGDREVLVVGGQLVADLEIELVGETLCGQLHSSTVDGRSRRGVRRPWQLLLGDLATVDADEHAPLDRIPLGQGAVLEHPHADSGCTASWRRSTSPSEACAPCSWSCPQADLPRT